MKADALLDTNVVIAMVVEAHVYHEQSLAMLTNRNEMRLAIAAHSYAEAYSTLTRRAEHAPFRFTPEKAWGALQSLKTVTMLVALTASQTFDTIASYARLGGIGPRLYDRLIGETAVVHGIPLIVTWNFGHMRALFPSLPVVTPSEFPERG